MHEMSIITEIMIIVDDELKKHSATKLLSVKVHYGFLSQVVPDSLHFAFEALTANTMHQGAKLELEEIPAVLKCSNCENCFTPTKEELLYSTCTICKQAFGHIVQQGDELFVQHIEAE